MHLDTPWVEENTRDHSHCGKKSTSFQQTLVLRCFGVLWWREWKSKVHAESSNPGADLLSVTLSVDQAHNSCALASEACGCGLTLLRMERPPYCSLVQRLFGCSPNYQCFDPWPDGTMRIHHHIVFYFIDLNVQLMLIMLADVSHGGT